MSQIDKKVIIQRYLELQKYQQKNLNSKCEKQEKQEKSVDFFIQIENTCDRLIENIDKLMKYITKE